jgi:hypothetical protein
VRTLETSGRAKRTGAGPAFRTFRHGTGQAGAGVEGLSHAGFPGGDQNLRGDRAGGHVTITPPTTAIRQHRKLPEQKQNTEGRQTNHPNG